MNYADKFKCCQVLSTATYQNISEYGHKIPQSNTETNLRHREEETQSTNNHMTTTTQLKQSNQLSLSLSISLSLSLSLSQCWLVGFVALRPKSTAMVIAGRSVHLTTRFPGQA